MRRALLCVGYSPVDGVRLREYAVIALDRSPLEGSFEAWQRLAAEHEVEVSASWLLLGDGAGRVSDDVRAGFRGCVVVATGGIHAPPGGWTRPLAVPGPHRLRNREEAMRPPSAGGEAPCIYERRVRSFPSRPRAAAPGGAWPGWRLGRGDQQRRLRPPCEGPPPSRGSAIRARRDRGGSPRRGFLRHIRAESSPGAASGRQAGRPGQGNRIHAVPCRRASHGRRLGRQRPAISHVTGWSSTELMRTMRRRV